MSLQFIQCTLKKIVTRHIVALPRLGLNGKLLGDSWAKANVHQCRRLVYNQAGQQHASVPQDDEGVFNSRENLLNKIKKSHKEYKIVSLPNVIATSRALMAPAIGYFIMNNMHSPALVCCAYAAFSDVAEKVVAKVANQSSPLNFTLDALADKLVIVTSCIALHKVDILTVFFLKSVILRDVFILGGAATMRYHGFDDRPTLRQYLDLNNYPSLCFKATHTNRLITGLQYSLIMACLGLNHLTGNSTYDWTMFFYQGLIMLLSGFSMGWVVVLFLQDRFFCEPKR